MDFGDLVGEAVPGEGLGMGRALVGGGEDEARRRVEAGGDHQVSERAADVGMTGGVGLKGALERGRGATRVTQRDRDRFVDALRGQGANCRARREGAPEESPSEMQQVDADVEQCAGAERRIGVALQAVLARDRSRSRPRVTGPRRWRRRR